MVSLSTSKGLLRSTNSAPARRPGPITITNVTIPIPLMCAFLLRSPSVSLLAQILYRNGKAFDLVVLTANVAGLGPDEDADSGERLSGFPKFVPGYNDRLGFAVDVDCNAFFAPAIDDAVSLKAIPVRRKGLVPAAKVDTRFATPSDVIITNEVVRITVTKGHSVRAVFDYVLLVESMLGAPAEVDALATTLHSVATDDRTLRPRAGVKGESDAIVH